MFKRLDDGYWFSELKDLSFLIGDTGEEVSAIGLWVTRNDELNYRMIGRRKFVGNLKEMIDELKNESRVEVVKSRVIGEDKFWKYVCEKQDDVYSDMKFDALK